MYEKSSALLAGSGLRKIVLWLVGPTQKENPQSMNQLNITLKALRDITIFIFLVESTP